MSEFPDDEIEFDRAWSMKAGEVSGLSAGKSLALTDAAYYYQNGHDETANALRDLGNRLKDMHNKASIELRAYIGESERRRTLRTHAAQG